MPLDQPEKTDPVDAFRMPLGEHIEELRKCLIHALIGVAIALIIAFIYCFQIMAWIATPLLQAQYALGYAPQTVSTDASFGFLTVYVPVALIAAVIFASPWIIFQIWRFVVTGLYRHERRAVYVLAPFSTVMTVLGVLFTRYVLLPVCVVFFLAFAAKSPEIDVGNREWLIDQLTGGKTQTVQSTGTQPMQLPILGKDPASPVEGTIWINRSDMRIKFFMDGTTHAVMISNNRLLTPLPDLGRQVKFAAMLGLGIVIAFQLPVFMLVLGWTGLVDPKQVARLRRYALFVSAAIAAVLTPSDPISMFVLWLPLYGLFEFGLLLMRLVDPHKRMPDEL